ncbi:hypothetical protein BC628DRAFT_485268 [Trametes gibbosa]|nr:hypothetical protein BC628DRAFT_485268 [Trametes gibbosa]
MARTRPNSLEREEDDGAPDDGAAKVFAKDGRPVYFYLYGTNEPQNLGALTEGQREDMTRLIAEHGGLICKSAARSDTIIVTTAGFETLKNKYSLERDIYVELPSFVHRCIAKGVYEHQTVARLPLGGVPPRTANLELCLSSRTKFTEEDEMNLCRFIASHMPYKGAGGRTGQKAYLELVEKARYKDLDYQWVTRHTAQSWRERYKVHQERLDPLIEELVLQNPPPEDGNGIRPFDRRVNRKGLFALAQVQEAEDGEIEFDREDEEDAEEQSFETNPRPRPNRIAQVRVAGQRARHTDVGPRRSPSPVEGVSRRARSMPGTKRPQPEHDSDDDAGEFRSGTPQFEQYLEDDHQPGPGEAGPSRTQRTSPSPAPPRQAAQAPVVRPAARVIEKELRAAAHRTRAREPQVPMSSQATLVGPVPTQLRGAAAAAKLPPTTPAGPSHEGDEAPVPVEKRASKRRKIKAAPPPPPVVVLEPLRRAGVGSRSALQPMARKTAPRPASPHQAGPSSRAVVTDEQDDESSQDDVEMTDTPQSDEQDVEALLQDANAESNAEVSPSLPEASEDLDTDDQVSREKLLRHGLREQIVDDDDDEAFAESLDLTVGAPRSRSVSIPGVLFPSAGRAPVTPVPPLRRTNTNRSTASSALNVPLPGTRASEKKKQARERERHVPYVPPSETRAAMMLKLRSRAGGRA